MYFSKKSTGLILLATTLAVAAPIPQEAGFGAGCDAVRLAGIT